ncbi:MAG: hypothetical protein WA814_00430 [Candidatus Baltobacteraceae bacterium]
MLPSPNLARALIAAIAYGLLTAGPANATGTIDIQHKDGTVKHYHDVEIKVFAGSLFLTSGDGGGTIVVTRAACSYQGQIIICLPTTAALVQDGQSDALNLKTGTIYLNYTSSPQPLSHTTTKLPPNSAMIAMTMRNGTFISLHGRIDQVIKQ